MGRFYEDLRLGESFESPGRTITEADLTIFAGFSGDYNPLHTDEEFAKGTAFKSRILHGPAGLAIATGLESRLGLKDGTALAMLGLTWEFKAPINIHDTVRVVERVKDKRETSKADRGIVTFAVQVVNQRDVVCQEGDWKVMMKRRPTE
jgi:acyl dehydratase